VPVASAETMVSIASKVPVASYRFSSVEHEIRAAAQVKAMMDVFI
jgi:hypothetical protein